MNERTELTEPTGIIPPYDDDADDEDFQPQARQRMHWLTVLLICLTLWAAGFLVGVLVDRSVAGVLG